MIGGQNADIEAEEQAEPLTTEQILFIHANKTAALIQSAMTIGATLAGATDVPTMSALHSRSRMTFWM